MRHSSRLTHAQPTRFARAARSRVFGFWCALLATLACQPALAVDGVPFDNKPLQSGASIPPNIMFILDNSGSMALVSMPFDVQDPEYTGTSTGAGQTGLKDNPHDRSYLNNTIYYNPNLQYNPWMNADGTTRMTGGTDPTQVYLDWNLADTGRGTRDLRDNSESIFYVPKTGVTSSTDPNDFVKYWVRNNGGTAQVVTSSASVLNTWTQTISKGNWAYQTITVPTGTIQLLIQISGNSNARGNADLYVRRTANPTTGNYDYADTGSGSTESVTINNPTTGTWRIGVYNSDTGGSTARDVVGNILTVTAYSAVPGTPTGRSQDDELKNIATWYSYYRTRIKTAKGGASEAFSTMTRDARVGYTPINGRSANLSATGTGAIIPVNTNGGLFETANKTSWFTSVQSEIVKAGSTPLRTTLDAVGQYYTRSDANGPWGPSTDNQLSCRQSFSILTTDGYWNDSSAGTTTGDQDGDGHSVTLADVAMRYYNTDLRTLTNNVPTSTKDTANWQHMSTFSVSIGLKGNMTVTDPPPAFDSPSWTDPMDAEDEDRIDDLWHAAVNGRGEFVAASNPTEFASALQSALASIQERNASSTNVTATSSSFSSGTQIFLSKYVTGLWTGEISAQPVVGTTPAAWTTNTTGQIPAFGSRKIYAWGAAKGTFTWDNLTTTQKAALGDATTGPKVLDYLRGDQSGEGTTADKFRQRSRLLGDIIDSSPFYVSESTPAMIYAGANDGMLHGFNATTGAEVFAYVPKGIDYSKLKTLSDQTYSHQYFVDGPVAVSTRAVTPGKNILVGSLGRGGKTIYALNVSNPGSFGGTSILWEKSSADSGYSALGNMVGAPVIVQLNAKKGDGSNKVGVIVGNGYNSSTGHSGILILDIDDGSIIKAFDTGIGGTATEADGNGMAEPSVWDVNRSGTADYVYAGDLKGNVWKFDISSSDTSQWGNKVSGSAPLFSTGGQPVTGGISIGIDPATYKRWLFFGTGRYLTTADPANRTQQTWYAVIDADAVVAVSDLQSRVITVDGSGNRTFPANGALGTDKMGWYVNLTIPSDTAEGSERIVTRPVLDGRLLVVSSAIPGNTACSPGGRGYVNYIDPFTGTSLPKPYVDTNGDGSVNTGDANGDGVPVGSVPIDGMPSTPVILYGTNGEAQVCVQDSNGELQCNRAQFPIIPGRISWREIIRN
ncbi:MAG: PilC/PilY family type IV pilus protein [Thermomonas sp.]